MSSFSCGNTAEVIACFSPGGSWAEACACAGSDLRGIVDRSASGTCDDSCDLSLVAAAGIVGCLLLLPVRSSPELGFRTHQLVVGVRERSRPAAELCAYELR